MDKPIMEGEVHIGDIPIVDGLASKVMGEGCGKEAGLR